MTHRMKTLRERELATGDIVEFQIMSCITSTSQKFRIQHCTGYIELSFDEIRQFFIKKDCSDIFCCTIKVDCKTYQIFKLSFDDFKELVEGKRFRVYINSDVYTFRDLMYTKSLELFKYMVIDLSLKCDVTESPEMIKCTCFQFEEIVMTSLSHQ